MGSGSSEVTKTAGKNHPGCVATYFYLKSKPDSTTRISLEYLEADGKPIKKFSTDAKEKADKLSVKEGMNRFNWNMLYEDAKRFDGLIMWASTTRGPMALPGSYKVRLTVGGQAQEQSFELLQDPRTKASPMELKQQFDFLIEIRDKLSEMHQVIIDIRDVRNQLNQFKNRMGADTTQKEVVDAIKTLNKQMTEIEETLYQTKNRSGQDPLNFPVKLNNKLAHVGTLSRVGDFPPTQQSQEVYNELVKEVDAKIQTWMKLKNQDIPALNRTIRDKQLDLIRLKPEPATGD